MYSDSLKNLRILLGTTTQWPLDQSSQLPIVFFPWALAWDYSCQENNLESGEEYGVCFRFKEKIFWHLSQLVHITHLKT